MADFDALIGFPAIRVGVRVRAERIAEIRLLAPQGALLVPRNALAERAARQLERYRDDPEARFDLPLLIEGTAFQRQVWEALCAIPSGRTRTYGELAREVRGEARAVGQACGDNRLPLVIPCHRAVAADGLGGFAHSTGGFPLEAKRWLLLHEMRPERFALVP
jgi:methylated-DNA-[protein]-cysteine S-methyltransferase